MNWLNNLLNRLTMYQAMVYYLRIMIGLSVILSYFDILPYTWWHILANLAALLVVCIGSNWIVSKIIGIKSNYESQFITAEILTLIMGPFHPLDNWQFILLAGVVSMVSKYVIVYKKRHIFNPAALAMVVSALVLSQSASWWAGSKYMLPVVVLGGLIMAYKLRWFHLVLTFLATYSALIVGFSLYDGVDLASSLTILRDTYLNSAILFFSFVMLTEPLTAPSRRQNRMIYGVFIAAVLIILQRFYFTIYYNLELALVIGNILAFVLSPNPKIRLRLKEKSYFARNSMILSFVPEKPIKYLPGQYMQFTLPHHKVDSRGIRRYFSIASSPSEETIMLATKFAEEGSSFKNALKDMPADESLLAHSLDGDFVLPKNQNQELVFIAGGVGIAPFRSMIKNILDNDLKYKITLFYANKDFDEIGFTDLFDEAEEKIGMKTVYTLTGKKIPGNWPGLTGFIDAKMVNDQVQDPQNKIFYLSGPDPMVRAYKKMLRDMGIKSSRIMTDYFPGYE
jgi:glycine betaine catabolism B